MSKFFIFSIDFIQDIGAFSGMSNLTELIIPDSWLIDDNYVSPGVFDGFPAGATIRCQGELEKCQRILQQYVEDENGSCSAKNKNSYAVCIKGEQSVDGNLVVTKCQDGFLKRSGSCISASGGCGSGYVRKYNECLSAESGCGAGWRVVSGTCFRIGYTPPEAAEITTDADNTLLLRYK